MNKLLYAAAVVATMVLASPCQAQSVNYNSSKSNTGNSPAPAPAPAATTTGCPGGVSKTAAGVCPQAASSATPMDPNSGAVTGRRQH